MSVHYNLNALSGSRNFSIYDLNKYHIIGSSTCSALYRHLPIQTDTLQRILEFCDCGLNDFLTEGGRSLPRRKHWKINFDDMIHRGVISRTSKRRYLQGLPMSLTTLGAIAADQGVDLLDILKEEVSFFRDAVGNLKKERKVVYLCEW